MAHKICILGAGLQGVLCALELAEKGFDVVIFDAANSALTKASRYNEGKIHLGYVYAKDLSENSSNLMARGATQFAPLLDRWWPQTQIDETASGFFDYLVMADSLENADWLEQRYRKMDAVLAERLNCASNRYLGAQKIGAVQRLDRRETENLYDTEFVRTAFRTSERAINLAAMAGALNQALSAQPRIDCRWNAKVEKVIENADGSFSIKLAGENPDGPYDQVVNALWGDRLRIDQTIGQVPDRPVMFRLKVAHYIQVPPGPSSQPCATMVIGPYGDYVGLPDGSCYLSWYPSGCIRRSLDHSPPKEWSEISQTELAKSFDLAACELSRRIPALRTLLDRRQRQESVPGIIFCWGSTDLDDPFSELHNRSNVGINTLRPGYHSIDTGKLTLAPLFAAQLAERISPK